MNNDIIRKSTKRKLKDRSNDDEGEEQQEEDELELNLNDIPESSGNLDITKFEEVFRYATSTLRNGAINLVEAATLQKYMNAFEAKTMNDHLLLTAAKLTSSNLNYDDNVAALKSTVSNIVNKVHPRAINVLKKYITDEEIWKSIGAKNPTLVEGLNQESKVLFDDIIKAGKDKSKMMQFSLLELAVCEKKTELLKQNIIDEEKKQLLDIIEIMIVNLSNLSENATPSSETTSYRHFAAIMDIILRKSKINFIDGEHVCKASKEVTLSNQRFESGVKKHQAFGRRIDMILASDEVELSFGEWKKESATASMSLHQQTKNVRVNKVILTKLLQYPLTDVQKEELFCLGIDFTGSHGYMFYIKSFKDIFIAKPISGLKLPQFVDEIADCYTTINYLFKLKNHNENMLRMLTPAIAEKKQEAFLKSMLYHEEDDDLVVVPPNVLFTPPKKRSVSN